MLNAGRHVDFQKTIMENGSKMVLDVSSNVFVKNGARAL